MRWIKREKPKIDRIACPWLNKNFVDIDAEIIYVPFAEVKSQAEAFNAIPFDIPEVEFKHYNNECTFDYIVRKYKINDPAIQIIATIVRGADTDQHGLAPEAAGWWAISAGLAYNTPDDYELLQKGMMLYDALYSWAKNLYNQKHLQNPFESLLLEVFHKVIQVDPKRKTPSWVNDIKEIIQDQIDTNFALTLTEIADSINANPSYISREFSKYFENLSFGDYIRKQRIERAIQLMETTTYSLTEIAFLTGFSDQSHFTRIFKKHTGQNPSDFKKNIAKK